MTRVGPVFFALGGAAVLIGAGIGCSNSDTMGVTEVGPDGGSPDTGGPPIGTFGDASSEDSPVYHYTCSEDLHQVFDQDGGLVSTCPDDQGCDPTKGCVPACDAANANQSAVGCDYYAVQPDGDYLNDQCYAIYVVNTWTSPVRLGLELGSRSFDVTRHARIPAGSGASLTYEPLPDGALPPGKTAIIFASGFNFNCGPGMDDGPPIVRPNVAGTDLGDAFHVFADRPVVAFDHFGYLGLAVASATLLQPTSSWGSNYVAVDSYTVPGPGMGNPSYPTPATLQIVAHDETTVTVVPSHDITDGFSIPGSPKNTPRTFSLTAGQVLQLASDESVTGSVIQANKPIGVWSSATFLLIPSDMLSGDTGHQQLPSVQLMGSEYVGVRYANRQTGGPEEAPPWRIMALVDGTTLTYDPAPPPGAPTTLGAGQLGEFKTAAPFSVKSQDKDHPLYVSAHMTTCNTLGDDPSSCPGDPEFVNVVPATQFLKSYTFFTNPNYTDTDLVVVRPKASDGTFKDVSLDCAGTLTGWTPVGTGGTYEYTRVDLAREGAPMNGCDNGTHTMTSEAPFGVTVWGWTWADSYAYPAGVRSIPVNSVVIPPVPR